jgi:hypothetical protein
MKRFFLPSVCFAYLSLFEREIASTACQALPSTSHEALSAEIAHRQQKAPDTTAGTEHI